MPNATVRAAAIGLPAATFIQITPRIRRTLEALIDDLVLFLDEVDGDADLEPTMGDVREGHLDECELEADAEASLGWSKTGAIGRFDMSEAFADLEGDEHEDDEAGGDDEPSLGWTGIGNTSNGGQRGVLDGEESAR